MSAECPIKFRTTRTSGRLVEGQVLYQGQILHNKTLTAAETRRLFAEYTGSKVPQSNLYLDMLGEFMADYLAQGYRLNFGAFSAGLKLNGSFASANAAFDPKVNSIGVELKPYSALRAATESLKPVNATVGVSSRLFVTYQQTPYEAYDEIACEGERRLDASGDCIWVHPEAEGEGLWIENDAGERLLTGVVTDADHCRLTSTFTGSIAPGLYWFVVASRYDTSGELLRCRRRITAR